VAEKAKNQDLERRLRQADPDPEPDEAETGGAPFVANLPRRHDHNGRHTGVNVGWRPPTHADLPKLTPLGDTEEIE